MNLITQDFLESRQPHNRYQKLFLPVAVILIVAGSAIGGFYFYKKSRPIPTEKVAGTTAGQLPKAWLLKYFGTDNESDPKVGGADGDPDSDLLTNQQEYYFGTDPTKEDTDGDGEFDGLEVAFSQNPLGEGELALPQATRDYLKEYINTHQDLAEFSEQNILQQTENLFKPEREIVMDLPQDAELTIITQNDMESFEKYFTETESLTSFEAPEVENVQTSLLEMSDQELDLIISKLQAMVDLLKKTPVPSELLNIHKLKIAGVKAGVRMFELVRDNYNPAGSNDQFWADLFYQTAVAENAGILELAGWEETALKLKDQGGI